MQIAVIIAEFNPLHNGHKHLIDAAKNDGFQVVCAISGNFVQRGDVSIVSKFKRAEMALEVGADAVVEIPVPWSMSTAQNFALGGISQLLSLNIDTLYFGSECGNVDLLCKISEILLSDDFAIKIKNHLKEGKTFAKIRYELMRDLIGKDAEVLNTPNDTLAIEYICAAKKLSANIEFTAIKRVGAGHNDISPTEKYSNATSIRNAIHKNNSEFINKYMPKEAIKILNNSPIADIERIDSAIMARLKLLKPKDFKLIPDISEGLDRLIYKNIHRSFNFEDLSLLTKSKRYTMARIRRIILSAFLGISDSYFGTEPPYVRLLGFNQNFSKFIPKTSKKPIITRVSQISTLDLKAKELFELENLINEVYALSLNDPKKFIDERSAKLIIK